MPRLLLVLLSLTALTQKGGAAEERGADLVRELRLRVEQAVTSARPSIACILVSRSESYHKAPHWGVEADPEQPGRLGRFDAAAAAKLVPTGISNRGRFLRTIIQHDLSDPATVPESFGSGVVVDKTGLILTNAHVVQRATRIYVRLPGQRGSWADVHASDRRSDLAVLKLLDPPEDLKALELGDGGAVRTGQLVITLCNSYAPGFLPTSDPTPDHGLVTKLRQRFDPIRSLNEEQRHKLTLHHYGTLIKTNAASAPGCSGGALLDLEGKVIGLTCALAAISGGTGGFAIPLDRSTARIVEILKRGEEVEYGFLGVMLQTAGGGPGVRVHRVTPNSPASRGGIMAGDQIVGVNGHAIREHDDLFLQIGLGLAGHTARIEVSRGPGGLTQTRTVKLAKFYVGDNVIASKRPPARFGLRIDHSSILTQRNPFPGFSRTTPDGVVVREVIHGSPADRARLQPDKIITQVNGRPVTSPAEYHQAMTRTGKKVELTFLTSDGRSEKLTLEEK